MIFAWAVYRLGGRGFETLTAGLTVPQWTALTVLVLGFVYVEGIRALQHRWVPRMLGRASQLDEEERRTPRIVGPLFAMSLLFAPRTQMARAWLLTSGIVSMVVLVRLLPDPWRGIVDLAVAAALAWGIGAILVAMARGGGPRLT